MFRLKIREEEKPVEYTQVGKKKTIHLPLKIPQGIIDLLTRYKEWGKREDRTGEEKTEILHRLSQEAKRWHLYAGFEAIAGTFLIHTKVGVSIIVGSKHPDYPYFQATGRDPFQEAWGKTESPTERTLKSGKCYKYVWDNPDE
jgi:hypothetical protein